MSKRTTDTIAQLGFDALLIEAEETNLARQVERETAHLPSTMDEALPFFRELLLRHHEAMLAADEAAIMEARTEADRLAVRLNKGEPGILADEESPARVLERITAAKAGEVPLWGQQGNFIIEVGTMRVRIEMDGLYCIGSIVSPWPWFSAHAVEWDRPFLSETGYRSFVGIFAPLQAGMTPETFAREVVAAHVQQELRGKLRSIKPKYRE